MDWMLSTCTGECASFLLNLLIQTLIPSVKYITDTSRNHVLPAIWAYHSYIKWTPKIHHQNDIITLQLPWPKIEVFFVVSFSLPCSYPLLSLTNKGFRSSSPLNLSWIFIIVSSLAHWPLCFLSYPAWSFT